MTGQKWTIYWNEYASDTYLYGSGIRMNGRDDVSFENRLMPPGTIIKTWYSKTNFQRQRIEPSLPIIDGESEYEITARIDYPQGGRCILRLVFLDKYEEEAGIFLVREDHARFRCPLKTYSYRMELMNAGTSAFRFHSVTIQEVSDHDESRTV